MIPVKSIIHAETISAIHLQRYGVSNFFAKVLLLFPNMYVQLKRQAFGHY
jgi:hypothetical protein